MQRKYEKLDREFVSAAIEHAPLARALLTRDAD